jgi:hypothetical protein
MRELDQIIAYLLEHAGCSIRYRVRRDLLSESVTSNAMRSLQEDILALSKVTKVFSTQQEDGFLGYELHGSYFKGFDANLMLLKRLGVSVDNPRIQRAKNALLEWKGTDDPFYRAGTTMDEYGRAGFKAVIANTLLDLECDEETHLIQEQIGLAVEAFAGAMTYGSIDEFARAAKYRGQDVRYYIKGSVFPDQNHIDILSKSVSWRNQANLQMVGKSYKHCYNLRKTYPQPLYINDGYFLGPFDRWWNFDRIDSVSGFGNQSIQFLWWLRRLEDPVYMPVSDFISYKKALTEWLSASDYKAFLPIDYTQKFKKYLSIESSWRKETSTQCDLILPAVMILGKRMKDDIAV